jgi:UDP-N-acetyl-2-amino-2-deoxyglucuronate dehydrogenase
MNDSPSHAVGFAVLGYGRIGQRHARLIQENPEATLVAIADPIAKEGPAGISCFADLESLLASREAKSIDIVTIATPNGLHVPQAMACLRAGKHVVVEKPVALHKKDACALFNLAAETGLQVFPVLQNRFTGGARWLKSLVDSGSLGSPILVQVNCFWNRDSRYYAKGNWHGNPELDGGVLFTQFSHFIDLICWLFGEVRDSSTLLVQTRQWTEAEFPDTGIVQFRLPLSGLGSIQFSTAVWDKNMESSISILAENGSVKVTGQYLNQLEYCHTKGEVPPFPTGPWSRESGHRTLIDNVVKVLKGKADPYMKASETISVIELIESFYKQIPS